VVTTHLEMTDPGELRPAREPALPLRVERAAIPCPELNRFLYTAVGGDWYWIDRLVWSYEEWLRYLDRPELETWVATVAGTPTGYFELERQAEGSVEIAYFGLLPRFIGRGLGGALLTRAARRAWEMGARRVWVHTCTLDGPAALANYRARGFRIFKEEVAEVDLPDVSPGPWPGARREAPGAR
jgi:GNAT superfamily N-acetyltransferase